MPQKATDTQKAGESVAQALVTGGGGFVGRYVVRQLIERGDSVRVLGRNQYPELAAAGAECVRGDISKQEVVARAVDGCDVVYHVAAIPGVWGSYSDYHRINVTGTEHVIAACQQYGVGRLVFTSSPSVVFDGGDHIDVDESVPYPDDYLCAYPKTKAIAEQLVMAADDPNGLRTVAIRPHLVFGPEDSSLTRRVIDRGRRGRLRIVGSGKNEVSVAYVENVAAAHLQAVDELAADARCAGRTYFVNEPNPVTVENWMNTLLSFGGLPPCQKHVPLAVAYTAGSLLETLWSLAFLSSEPPMTRFVALQLGKSHTYSIEAAQRDFDYRPIVEWDDAIRRTRDWYTANPV